MPLSGKLLSTNKTVYIWKFDDPRAQIRKGDLVCKLCGEPMGIRQGLVRAWHFYHLAVCTSDYAQHPESAEHLSAKQHILEFMCGQFKESLDSAETECALPEINRVADVLLIFKTGWRVAHEAQLSSITTGELAKRTADYRRAEIDVYWWLGRGAATETNLDWCYEHIGQVGELSFSKVSERVAL